MELEQVLDTLEDYADDIGADANISLDPVADVPFMVDVPLEEEEPSVKEEQEKQTVDNVLSVDGPIPVYLAEPEAVPLVNSDIYPGSFSSSVLDYFEGIMANNPGDDFVAWRASRYQYYLYWGDGFTVSGDVFSGTGDFVSYDTNSDGYIVSHGSGSFSVNASGGVAYTNVSDFYPTFMGVEQIQASNMLFFGLVVALGIWTACRILFR